MRSSRIDEIQEYVFTKKTATIDELCSHFGVSINTIRRDLGVLSSRGTIKKIYGGVTTTANDNFSVLLPFSERDIKNIEAKKKIAAAAAKYVSDNDIIYIDTGSTTVNVIDFLGDKQNVTVLTNSVQAIMRAMSHSTLKVIAVPGVLDRKVAAFTGTQTLKYLNNYNITKAFMACTAYSLKNGAMNSSPDEYAIKQAAVARSATSFLLADADKYDRSALLTYAKISDFSYLVSDMKKTSELDDFLRALPTSYIEV